MARIKKSLEEAKVRAQQHSAEHPGVTVRVLDKIRQHSVVCASEWIYKERILDGWYTAATYKAGKEV